VVADVLRVSARVSAGGGIQVFIQQSGDWGFLFWFLNDSFSASFLGILDSQGQG
jgi:hypothetical protein